MQRRAFIKSTLGTTSLVVIAGCSTRSNSDETADATEESTDTSEPTQTETSTVTKDPRDTDETNYLSGQYAKVKDEDNSGTKEIHMGATFTNPNDNSITVDIKFAFRFSNTEDRVSDAETWTVPPGTTANKFPIHELDGSDDYFTDAQRAALLENDFEFEMWVVK